MLFVCDQNGWVARLFLRLGTLGDAYVYRDPKGKTKFLRPPQLDMHSCFFKLRWHPKARFFESPLGLGPALFSSQPQGQLVGFDRRVWSPITFLRDPFVLCVEGNQKGKPHFERFPDLRHPFRGVSPN